MKTTLVTVCILLAALFSGCAQRAPGGDLSPVEITEYNGEKLGSTNDFRENSIKGVQNIDITTYRLKVAGLVERPQEYTYDQALSHANYSKVITLNCVEGWSVAALWEGVLVKDLVEEAGPQQGANTVIFRAYDGYTTSFPLGYIMARNIILAHKINNITLPAHNGYPFELAAEDKWGYKWIRWVTEIELSDDPNYEGYWEQRGYNNNGDLSGPIYG